MGRVFGFTEPNARPAGSEQLFGLTSRCIQAAKEASDERSVSERTWGADGNPGRRGPDALAAVCGGDPRTALV